MSGGLPTGRIAAPALAVAGLPASVAQQRSERVPPPLEGRARAPSIGVCIFLDSLMSVTIIIMVLRAWTPTLDRAASNRR